MFALAAVFAAGAPSAFAEDAIVPGVVGLPLDQAQLLLEQAGFNVSVQRVQGRTVGVVFSQEPGGRATRPKGTTVVLRVGGPPPKFRPPTAAPPGEPPAGAPPVGPDIGDPPTGIPPTAPIGREPPTRRPVMPEDPGVPPATAPLTWQGKPLPPEAAPNPNGPALPSVMGQPAAQARGALRRWRVSIEYTLAIPELVGKVVNQRPHGGTTLAVGGAVVIVVAIAQPPSADHFGVPQVERRDWRAAAAALTAAGFRPSPTSVPSTNAERGLVLTQQPLPGSLAQRGARVRIRVGRGAGRAAPPTPPRVAPPVQPPSEPDVGPPAGVPPVAPPVAPPVSPPTPPPTEPLPAPGALPAPALSTPAAGEAYPHRYGATFSWTAIPGASAYEWELEEELPSGAWRKVGSRMVPGPKFRPDELQRGRYRWRVRAVHQATKGAWSGYWRLYMY
jgi:beta-lactam-binding protein with PASTA domain